jgi:two-component system response regulator PilR (NtrC family)
VIEVANLALKGARIVSGQERVQERGQERGQELAPVEADPADGALPDCLPDYLDQVERDIISRALARTRFNRTQAAQLLGISLRQLRYQMQRLSIHEPEP